MPPSIDKEVLRREALSVLTTTRSAIGRVMDKASEKERAILADADNDAATIHARLSSQTITLEAALSASESIERTMRNRLEALDDKTRKEAQHVTVRSAILGGFQMILGVLGAIRF